MPNPEKGCNDLNDIFIEHIYKDRSNAWELTAAISGSHTLGSCKLEASGYNGFWSDAVNSGIFNNNYYESLVLKGWSPEL